MHWRNCIWARIYSSCKPIAHKTKTRSFLLSLLVLWLLHPMLAYSFEKNQFKLSFSVTPAAWLLDHLSKCRRWNLISFHPAGYFNQKTSVISTKESRKIGSSVYGKVLLIFIDEEWTKLPSGYQSKGNCLTEENRLPTNLESIVNAYVLYHATVDTC